MIQKSNWSAKTSVESVTTTSEHKPQLDYYQFHAKFGQQVIQRTFKTNQQSQYLLQTLERIIEKLIEKNDNLILQRERILKENEWLKVHISYYKQVILKNTIISNHGYQSESKKNYTYDPSDQKIKKISNPIQCYSQIKESKIYAQNKLFKLNYSQGFKQSKLDCLVNTFEKEKKYNLQKISLKDIEGNFIKIIQISKTCLHNQNSQFQNCQDPEQQESLQQFELCSNGSSHKPTVNKYIHDLTDWSPKKKNLKQVLMNLQIDKGLQNIQKNERFKIPQQFRDQLTEQNNLITHEEN